MTAAVAPAGANLLHNMQTSTSSSVVDIDLAQASSKPQSVRFYCSDVPDFTEFFYSKKLSDVNIVIGDRKISAHRSRLASVSPFLASVFSSDNSEVSTVILPDVSYQAANVLVNFLYSGYMRVAKKEVTLVLEVASLLGINYPIDVEETEIGVVRIKPLDPKKRNAGSELGGGFAKRARKEMPRVAIYDGDKSELTTFMDQLATPPTSPQSSSRVHDVVTLMDVDEITILPSSIISHHNFDHVADPQETNIIFLDNNDDSGSNSPIFSVSTPPLCSSPRPRSRIKKTKTRNDLLNEAQQNQLEQVSIMLVNKESAEVSSLPQSSASTSENAHSNPEQNSKEHPDEQQPAEKLNDSDQMQPIVLSVEGSLAFPGGPPILCFLATATEPEDAEVPEGTAATEQPEETATSIKENLGESSKETPDEEEKSSEEVGMNQDGGEIVESKDNEKDGAEDKEDDVIEHKEDDVEDKKDDHEDKAEDDVEMQIEESGGDAVAQSESESEEPEKEIADDEEQASENNAENDEADGKEQEDDGLGEELHYESPAEDKSDAPDDTDSFKSADNEGADKSASS